MTQGNSPEAVAAAMRDSEASEAGVKEAAAVAIARAKSDCLLDAYQQIIALKDEPSSGIRLTCRKELDAAGNVTALLVKLGVYPMWMAHPMLICRVVADSWAPAVPDWSRLDVVYPAERSDPLHADLGDLLARYEKEHGPPSSPLQNLRVLVGACVALKARATWGTPVWYRTIGTVVGWPIALVTYLAIAVSGGWLGVLLGWIPALIAYVVAKELWAPAVAATAYYLLR